MSKEGTHEHSHNKWRIFALQNKNKSETLLKAMRMSQIGLKKFLKNCEMFLCSHGNKFTHFDISFINYLICSGNKSENYLHLLSTIIFSL